MKTPHLGSCALLLGYIVISGCSQQTGIPQRLGYTPNVNVLSHSDPTPLSYHVLYSFGGAPDGANPAAGLISVNGTLYGTTWDGGKPANDGTVYSISTTGAEKVLHRFGGGSDGSEPAAGLLNVNGTLYGTTKFGGTANDGTVYSISTTGTEKVLHSFAGSSDGAKPDAGLINVSGTLYGTTVEGGGGSKCGAYGCGTVYRISTAGAEKVVYRFAGGSDGAFPGAGLLNVNGTLYGTTHSAGGSGCNGFGCGTVYSVSTSGAEKVLYRFAGGSDGASPEAGLVDLNGTLYGTTVEGGSNCASVGCGTVYSVSTGGKEKVLYRFASGTDGELPYAGLINVNGTLYGTTFAGGIASQYGYGIVFSITTTGTEKVVHRFAGGAGGAWPEAGLIDYNGTLYGTTDVGGSSACSRGCGTVFAASP